MKYFTVKKINRWLLFKLPAAYFTGVRLSKLTDEKSEATVRFGWKNQNPFKSIYFAVLAMAAELTTGIYLTRQIFESKKNISMLVIGQTARFHKKAVGTITFSCTEKEAIAKAIAQTIKTGEGQVFILKSDGYNEQGNLVASFTFEWSVKVKAKK